MFAKTEGFGDPPADGAADARPQARSSGAPSARRLLLAAGAMPGSHMETEESGRNLDAWST